MHTESPTFNIVSGALVVTGLNYDQLIAVTETYAQQWPNFIAERLTAQPARGDTPAYFAISNYPHNPIAYIPSTSADEMFAKTHIEDDDIPEWNAVALIALGDAVDDNTAAWDTFSEEVQTFIAIITTMQDPQSHTPAFFSGTLMKYPATHWQGMAPTDIAVSNVIASTPVSTNIMPAHGTIERFTVVPGPHRNHVVHEDGYMTITWTHGHMH